MQQCKACNYVRVQALDEDLLAGVLPVTQIALNHHLSYSGVRYHAAHHLGKNVMVVPQAGPEHRTADLLTQYVEALDDTAVVRTFAIQKQRPELLLRASRERRAALEFLFTTLGINSAEIVEQLARAEAYTDAMTDLIRRSPRYGMALALQLEENDQRDIAASVKSYATFRQNLLDQKAEATS